MKLVFDERVKHRLIGLAVIISIAAIFTPAMVRKSNQKLDKQMQLSVRIPPKPSLPRVVMPNEEVMFKQAKVVHLAIPTPPEKPTLVLAKATPLHESVEEKAASAPETASSKDPNQTHKNTKEPNRSDRNATEDKTAPTLGPSVQASPPVSKTVAYHAALRESGASQSPNTRQKASLALSNARKREKTLTQSQQKKSTKLSKNTYGIQVASFIKQKNAIALTAKLRGQGYPTLYQTVQTQIGPRYKVIVGHVTQKEQAKVLQKQLASTLQLNGMIISGVS